MEDYKLKIKFPSYEEMNMRFDNALIKLQNYYNNSKDQLGTINSLRALRLENERIVEQNKIIINDLSSTLIERIESLKDITFIHVVTDDNIPGALPISKFENSGIEISESNKSLIERTLELQKKIFTSLSNFWYVEPNMIDNLIDKYHQLNARLIPKEKIDKPYFSLIARIFELGKVVQFRNQDAAILNYVIEKIIEEGNYLNNNGKIEFIEAPIGMSGMAAYIRKLKSEKNELVIQKNDETLDGRYERILKHLMKKFPNESQYPKKSTIRNSNWLNEK